MKRQIVMLVLLCVAALSAFPQAAKRGSVAGRVIDDSGEPVIQASVQLLALPDSSFVTGVATSPDGSFVLPRAKAGDYLLKVSYVGYKSRYLSLRLSPASRPQQVGTLQIEPDAVLLSEAVVVGQAPQVQVVEDTLQYNSSAYRTPQGAMLEELVKKLPGAEIDDDGNVKINGKDVSKIMVNGKEFFGGDVATGLKNLPVDIIENLKAYDKKSDLARITVERCVTGRRRPCSTSP